ncbi:MAG: hypothetical protein IH977_08585 [Nitrospinae bacterium]|nr:hypothetical protein [Nitrospinota bacterium]
MAEQLDPKEIVNLEGLALSNMWEVAALIEVLEKKASSPNRTSLTPCVSYAR